MKRRLLGFLIISTILVGLSACQAATPTPVPPTETQPPTATLPPTAEPTQEPTPTSPPPTPTEAVSSCITCHGDKQALIDTADPVEEVVSENEGEG